MGHKYYLGDEDTASFRKVCDEKPYGNDFTIEKLECVGHVQKRCGSRLRKLVNSYKGVKLVDGQSISGSGQLTGKMIDLLQRYYGLANRRNHGKLTDMVNAIWASLYHCGSTDSDPQHHMCPSDGWCEYNKNPTDYTHSHGLPQTILDLIEPIYEDLANPQLLSKCLHGGTQNPNESLNNVIWERCPKQVWVSRDVVEEATYQVISNFDDGYQSSTVKLLEILGLKPGLFTTWWCKMLDANRINRANRKNQASNKARRRTTRAHRKGYFDEKSEKEGIMYEKRAF